MEAHRTYLPTFDALPAGEDHFPRDVYDELVERFKEEGVPNWLN
jgi:hypothetical protein